MCGPGFNALKNWCSYSIGKFKVVQLRSDDVNLNLKNFIFKKN